jgi:hypothetical protein
MAVIVPQLAGELLVEKANPWTISSYHFTKTASDLDCTQGAATFWGEAWRSTL